MSPKLKASAITPSRAVAVCTSSNLNSPARIPSTKRRLRYDESGRKSKQKRIGELLEKTRLSGKLIYPVGNRAYLQGGESLYRQPSDIRSVGTRKNPLAKKSSNAYTTRYQLKLKRRNPKRWKSSPRPGLCPLCERAILPAHDSVWCHARSCTPVHRSCADEYHGRLCLCMGLLCDWHPDGRWRNDQGGPLPNRDKCVCCGGEWFPSISEVHDKWAVVLSTEFFQHHISRTFPQIPASAYHFNFTQLEYNEDFPNHGRNPMNVVQQQLNMGSSLVVAKDNTFIAYNANHHPMPPVGTPPQMYASLFRTEYVGAIDNGFFTSASYARYDYDRLYYYHDLPVNATPAMRNPTFNRWEWFNFQDELNKWFHLPSTPSRDIFRRLFEAAPPNGMLING